MLPKKIYILLFLTISIVSCKIDDDISPEGAQVNKSVSLISIDSSDNYKLLRLNSNNDPDTIIEPYVGKETVNNDIRNIYTYDYDAKKRIVNYSIYPDGDLSIPPDEYYVYFYKEPKCNPDSIYYYKFSNSDNFGYRHYVITYIYDNQDRPVKVYYKSPDSTLVYFAAGIKYDPQGNLTDIKSKNLLKNDSTVIYSATAFDDKESWYRSNKSLALTFFFIKVPMNTLDPYSSYSFFYYIDLPFPYYGRHNPTSDSFTSGKPRTIAYTYNEKNFPTQIKTDNLSPINLNYK